MRPIGYYVHHHGDGHRQRARAVAACGPKRFTLIGTGLGGLADEIATLDLPDDRLTAGGFDGVDGETDRPEALHYAPLNHDGVRARMGAIAAWIAGKRPSLIVVDVSVEVALLARLCATPVAYVRLGGQRGDRPHLEAFRSAECLIAPFSERLDDLDMPAWVRRKTIYAPGIAPRRIDATSIHGRVLVVVGRGGSSVTPELIASAARHTPDCVWRVIGMAAPDTLASNVNFLGWSDDPEGEIARAEIVIGGAGDGLVGAVLAAQRPFVCIPERRPFNEQQAKAWALERAGAAIVHEGWPVADAWPGILTAARLLDPATQGLLDDPNGAERMAAALLAVADRQK